MKILTIIGARPQFVKAAVLSRVIRERVGITEIIVHTGQHFDTEMSDIFFKEMDIPKPKYNLGIHSKTHGQMTGEMLVAIEEICYSEQPDVVLVYGDTNSTLAGALAASKLNIKVAHVEAGLRSRNMGMPEEVNRILTDQISNFNFCPTENALNNLVNEGFKARKDVLIINSGDIMQDAFIYYRNKGRFSSSLFRDIVDENVRYILATIHRAENTKNVHRLQSIIAALNSLNEKCKVIVPLHPATRKIIEKNNIKIYFDIIEPQSYQTMQSLLCHCSLVITDSGGLQKEAFFGSKYCITVRDETEWIELIENGYNFVVGTRSEDIFEKASELLERDYPENINLYGNGNAAELIIDTLMEYVD